MEYRDYKSVTVIKKSAVNILLFVILLYFLFHSIYGSRGIISYFKLQAELERSHKTLEMLRAERLEIENRTRLLRPNSLDKDLLDEKARNVLGLAKPNEQVFMVKDLAVDQQLETKNLNNE
ncbi:MAG: septum formation initiator family protein [Rickettsiaceae bacterium]|nr:septum formation initiator family protein [Rickettsiaceae bacterium]